MATKSQLDIIKRFMKSLDTTNASGKNALNAAVNYASGGYFTDVDAAINKIVADCKKLGADKFLLQKCGINLDNKDTGAITGYDAGGKKILTAESVVPESGKLATNFTATSFEICGVTFRLSKKTLTSNERYIWQALKTWWAKESLTLNEKSFGYSFNDTDAAMKEITVVFNNEPSKSYLAYVDDSGGKLTLAINKGAFQTFSDTDVNGKSSKYPVYLDRTIAHEMTHALMIAKVNNFNALPKFIKEGLGELTRGIDDIRPTAIKNLAKNSSTLKKYLTMATGGSSAYIYAAGYIFLRYLAKQGAENFSVKTSDLVSVKSTVLTVAKNFSGTLDLDDYSAKIKTVKADTLTKAAMILGNDNANSIFGGKKNDTLAGGKGNDTLAGGSGSDIFVYSEGNDVITDWTADDKISLTAALSDTTLNGSDVVLKIGSGSLTVKNAKGKTLNVITSTGENFSNVLGGSTLTLTNAATSPVTVDSAVKKIDASSRTKAIKIIGNAKANSIVGGAGNDCISGGKGNDSIFGGAGNDSLWGNAGNDKFFCGEGDDIIFGFANGDTLTLDNLKFKTSYKDGVVNLTFDGGSVALKNFSATTFHINDDVYKISGKKLVKQ